MSLHQPMTLPSQEELSRLASENPQAFEALRTELIEDCISTAPEALQPRLRGIQFRVDCIRRLSRTPLSALIKIQSMMWDSFLRMDRELQRVARPADGAWSRSSQDGRPAQSALILEFHPRLPMRTG